jgi:hypothetical protein
LAEKQRMSLSFSIDVLDRATPAIKEKVAATSPQRLRAFVGPAVSLAVKEHFLMLPHNRRGWKPANFWPSAARATNWQTVPDGVVISVNQIGVRQRYQGGPILPVNAKALAIPVAEQAYGKTPRDFGGQLQLVVIKGKGAWLALKSFEQRPQDKQKGRKKQQGPGITTVRERLKFLFLLCAGVEQAPDPNVLPTEEEIRITAVTAIKEAIK